MQKPRFHRNVILTGFASFFTDVSADMVYPLLQAFLAAIMTTQKTMLGPVLGLIEGIAESTASLLKVVAGYYSDRVQKRKTPTVLGYGMSASSKLLFLLASMGWWFVLLGRFFDRVGKGIRTAPRDALISESTPKESVGRAFGFQRGMDFAGATLGALICFFLVQRLIDPATGSLRDLKAFYLIFAISVIPAFVAVSFLFFTRETGKDLSLIEKKDRPKPNLDIRGYDRNLRLFFLATAIFTLGNSSNQFLLLRSRDVGISLSSVILMYLLLNLSTALFAVPFGTLSDRIGRKKLLVVGLALYAVVYLCFGFITREVNWLLWFFWPLYGLYYALTEGVEKAFVSELAPVGSRATALGFHHTIVGIGLLPASVLAGLLFALHPALPFVFGGVTATVAVAIVAGWVREERRGKTVSDYAAK